MNYKVIFFGTWGYGKYGLRSLLSSSKIEVIQVFTKFELNSINPYMNQVYELAVENGIDVINTSKNLLKRSAFEEAVLKNNDIDFIVSCCFDRILHQNIIQLPKFAAINVHPSLLPQYRGVKPLENAIVNGENETGVTIHKLEKEIDSGDIILQRGGIEISLEKMYNELYNEQCYLIEELLVDFFSKPIQYLKNTVRQDEKKVSYAPRLQQKIDDNTTVKQIRINFSNGNEP